jgi:ACR3 family arsenite efflux pump ArsB
VKQCILNLNSTTLRYKENHKIGFIVVYTEVNIYFMFRTLIYICIYLVFLIVFSRKDKKIITNAQSIVYCYVCLIFLLLCMFRSLYSVYCLCVNAYCTAATGCQPNCS